MIQNHNWKKLSNSFKMSNIRRHFLVCDKKRFFCMGWNQWSNHKNLGCFLLQFVRVFCLVKLWINTATNRLSKSLFAIHIDICKIFGLQRDDTRHFLKRHCATKWRHIDTRKVPLIVLKNRIQKDDKRHFLWRHCATKWRHIDN